MLTKVALIPWWILHSASEEEEGAGIWSLCFRNHVSSHSGAKQEKGLELIREVGTQIVDGRENPNTPTWSSRLLSKAAGALWSISAATISKHGSVSIAHPGFELSPLASLDAVHWSSHLDSPFLTCPFKPMTCFNSLPGFGVQLLPKVTASVPYSSPVGR